MNSYSCLFSASYQQIYNTLYKALVSEYFLVIFALSFSHSFQVGHDCVVKYISITPNMQLNMNKFCNIVLSGIMISPYGSLSVIFSVHDLDTKRVRPQPNFSSCFFF